MPTDRDEIVWVAASPSAWPEPPREMNFSLLAELETCPRRWALVSAEYPGLWQRHGYPPRLQLSGLTGTVVHLAIEELTRALVHVGCSSLQTPEAVSAMRGLGGYSALLGGSIERVLRPYVRNPRTAHLIDMAARTLRSRVPEMRAQIQGLLGRVRLGAVRHVMREGMHVPSERTRQPLSLGVYPELEVRAPKIGWRGKIDLLTISESHSEIIDFKTSAANDRHVFQVRIYSLLWSRDTQLNPTGRPADRLTLAYPSENVTVDAPSSTELDAIESEVVERTIAARAATDKPLPEARPSAETCRYCSVRHLCEEYWNPATQRRIGEERADRSPFDDFADMELVIAGRHGPASWDGVVAASRGHATGRRVVLRTESSGPEFDAGDRVRVLDAHVTVPQKESDPGVATLGVLSEVFLVPRP